MCVCEREREIERERERERERKRERERERDQHCVVYVQARPYMLFASFIIGRHSSCSDALK